MLKNKTLKVNFLSLSVLQLANYVFPFLLVPYLSRILTPAHYGLILFAMSFNAYFAIVCDYGFNLTGTKDIAVSAGDSNHVNRLFSSITYIKLVFFAFSALSVLIVIIIFPKFRADWVVYLLSLLTLVTNVFFPIWLFQGLERMRFITIITIIIRTLALVLTFMFVHHDSQYVLVPLINGIAAIAGAVVAQYIVYKSLSIRYVCTSFVELKEQLVNGWHVFISTMAISLYTVSNGFFLGLFSTTTVVAYYLTAEKITNAISGMLQPITQTIYPHLAKTVAQDRSLGIKKLQKSFYIIGGIGLCCSIFLFIVAPIIVNILLGAKYQAPTTLTLHILAILPFLVCLSNVLGIQTMIPFGLKKQFARILVASGIINVSIILILVPRYSYIGSACAVVVTESLVVAMMWWYLHIKGILIWRGLIKN